MTLKIEILCSSSAHPVVPWLARWMEHPSKQGSVSLVYSKSDLSSGDILFLISVSEMVGPDIRARFGHTVVVHASDLPEGRGWSPHVWAILRGAETLVVSALEAKEPVDSGAIWAKTRIEIPKIALCDEINERLFHATLGLMSKVCDKIEAGEQPVPQENRKSSYWPRRSPKDSEIDPNKSIESQFDAIRVSDPARYPAYFQLHGEVFEVHLKKRPKT